jgi:hypothetical protein
MSLTKLSLGGNNDVIYKLFPPRECLVSDIPAGDGNIEKLFLRCEHSRKEPFKQLVNSYLEHVHMSLRLSENARDRRKLDPSQKFWTKNPKAICRIYILTGFSYSVGERGENPRIVKAAHVITIQNIPLFA